MRTLLRDNRGDENIAKLVWIVIAFILGAILVAMLSTAFKGPVRNWFQRQVTSWFNNQSDINAEGYNLGGNSTIVDQHNAT